MLPTEPMTRTERYLARLAGQDVQSLTAFTCLNSASYINTRNASNSLGIRPYFLLGKAF